MNSNRATVAGISKDTGIHRRNVYDTLNKLVERGLVFQLFADEENYFSAVNPDKLLELVQEKEELLRGVLPTLKKSYESHSTSQAVYIYRGVQGFKNYLRDVIRQREDVFSIGAKGFWFDPRIRQFTQGFLKEAREKRISFYHLFDAEVKSELAEILKVLPPTYRFLPKKYSSKVITNIFSDRVVTFTGVGLADLGSDISLHIVVNRVIADGYRKWFEFMWENSDLPKARKR